VRSSRLLQLISILVVVAIPQLASAARFYFSPSSGSYTVGQTITANVLIDSEGQAINAGEGNVNFSSDIISYQSVSTSGSIFSFWTSGPSGDSTHVNFGGGLSNPGYSGSSGKMFSISWKALANGTATVSISNGKILANDGAGTNVYGGSGTASFTVGAAKPKAPGAPTVTSSTHPDQNKWYQAKNVSLAWSASSSLGYAFTFDQSSSTDPGSTTSSVKSKTYDNVADGVWYFHVKSKTDSGFTPITHFKVQIDTVPPDEFKASLEAGTLPTDPAPKVTFSATDGLSGIDHYDVKIDEGEWVQISSGDRLPRQKPGDHTVIIRAVDKAGNLRESSFKYTIIGIAPPTILEWDKSVALLSPVRFIGRSLPDDTIYVYLNGKEVDHFLAKDKQLPENDSSYPRYGGKGAKGEIEWVYVYSGTLSPGAQSFRFSRTDKDGAESSLTEPHRVLVNSSTITIGGHIFQTKYVVGMLLAIILLLIVLSVYLWSRLRTLAVLCAVPVAAFIKRSRRLLGGLEEELDQTVDKDIPNGEITKEKVEHFKHQLKDDIHKIIDKEEHELDDLH